MSNVSTGMFTGNVSHKLDPKSRVAVPANWRAVQDAVLTLIDAESDGYPVVKCYTKQAFDDKLDAIRMQAQALGKQPGEIDRYIGIIAGRSFQAEVSSQGKLLIPKQQRERLKLAENAVIVGRSDYFEIWNPDDFAIVNSPEAIKNIDLDRMFHILS